MMQVWFEDRKRILLTLFVVSFAIRLLFGVLVVGLDAPPQADAATYDQIGHNLATEGRYIQHYGKGIWLSSRPPLLPFVLAGLYSITGYSFVASHLLMIVLGSLVPLVVFALTDSVFKRKPAIIAGVIAAVYPSFILYSNRLMTETLLVLLVCLLIIFLIRFVRRGRMRDICAAGLTAGLACLCRPTVLSFIPVCVIWLVIVSRADPWRSLRAAALFAAFAVIVITPWTYRNYTVHGELVPISTRGGMSLWLGNNERATGNLGEDNEMLQSTMPDPGTHKETEMDRFYREEAMRFIRNHPKRFIVLGLKKIFHFWRPEGFRFPGLIDQTPKAVRFAIGFFSYMPVFLLFVVGCVRSLKQLRLFRDPALLLLALLVVTYTLLHGVYPSIGRYRQAIEPVIIAIGSWGLVGMLDAVRKRSLAVAPEQSSDGEH